MKSLQVQVAPDPLAILAVNLSDVLALPDAEAAIALNDRALLHAKIERLYTLSFAEVGIIAREVERRHLYRHLINSDTGKPFVYFNDWTKAINSIACRRTIFAAKRVIAKLEDVPPEKLVDIPPSNLYTMTQLSTAVRNDPAILEAARTLPREQFEEKVEREQPLQHISPLSPLRFHANRPDRKIVEETITWALNHDIAATRDEAFVRACETALNSWQLDDELAHMPIEEKSEVI